MNKLFWIMLAAVVCTGCAAEMMETRGDKIYVIKPPNLKPGRGGVIRYLNGGMPSWRERRRHNAESQMTQFCKGPYKITAEGPRSKFGSSMPTDSHISLEVDQYTYIAFDCEKN